MLLRTHSTLLPTSGRLSSGRGGRSPLLDWPSGKWMPRSWPRSTHSMSTPRTRRVTGSSPWTPRTRSPRRSLGCDRAGRVKLDPTFEPASRLVDQVAKEFANRDPAHDLRGHRQAFSRRSAAPSMTSLQSLGLDAELVGFVMSASAAAGYGASSVPTLYIPANFGSPTRRASRRHRVAGGRGVSGLSSNSRGPRPILLLGAALSVVEATKGPRAPAEERLEMAIMAAQCFPEALVHACEVGVSCSLRCGPA